MANDMPRLQALDRALALLTPAQWVWLAMSLTVVTRMLVALVLPVDPLQPDYSEYAALARSIVADGSYGFGEHWRQEPFLANSFNAYMYEAHGSTFRPPGFPALLAALDWMGIWTPRIVQLVCALADAGVAALLVRVALVHFGPRAALWALLGWLVEPRLLFGMTKLGREELYSLAVASICVLGYRLAEKPSVRLAVLIGVLAALGTYLKETVAVVAGGVVLWLLWHAWQARQWRGVGIAAVLSATLALGLAPWAVRNTQVRGTPTGFTANGAVLLAQGLTTQKWRNEMARTDPERYDLSRVTTASEASVRLGALTEVWVRTHPVRAGWQLIANIGYLWSPISRWTWEGEPLNRGEVPGTVMELVLFALAGMGLWRARRSAIGQFVLLQLVLFSLAHAPTFAQPRYRTPMLALLILFAGARLAGWRHEAPTTTDAQA